MALASNVIKHDMNVVPGPIFYDYSLHPLYNLLQHQKANILLYKVLFFIQVLSSENKLYDEVKSLNHKINAF